MKGSNVLPTNGGHCMRRTVLAKSCLAPKNKIKKLKQNQISIYRLSGNVFVTGQDVLFLINLNDFDYRDFIRPKCLT
jgi:hypothetical protein